MFEDIKLRLAGFGYELVEGDEELIDYLLRKVEEMVQNATNLDVVPEGLRFSLIDWVCAEFLEMAYSVGKLKDVDRVVKSIQEGDTTVTYSETVTPESKFLAHIRVMKFDPKKVVRYRVFQW